MTTYPPSTPASMQMLVSLLGRWGVSLRVFDGELQLRDPEKRLTEADRAMVRAYAPKLARVLSNPPASVSHRSTVARDPIECRSCGADLQGDAVTYRTDACGVLLERCVACGETWVWGDPEDNVAPLNPVTKPP